MGRGHPADGSSQGVRAIVGACIAFGLLGLPGCEPAINQGPLAIRLLDDQLELAVCEAITVKSVLAGWRESGGEWEIFADARGDTATPAGTVFDMSFAGELTPAASEPPIDLVDELNVLIEGDDRNIHGLWSDLQENPLESAWRHPDGSDSTVPCE